jgi:hypothetical protein
MRKTAALLALLVLLIFGGLTQAQGAQTVSTIPQVLNHNIAGVESEFVPAAEAMPEEKYAFVPTSGEFKGVRTFAEQVKHVAAVNYMVGAAILDEKPPIELGGENGPEAIKSKADIVKFLKDSFVYVHRALTNVNENNLLKPVKSPFGDGKTNCLALGTLIAAHCFDHYGQIVVYLRMNSIVPPASR